MSLSKQRIATGILLFAISVLLVSCGSSQNTQGREALRFNPSLPQAFIADPFNFSFVADGGQRPYRYNLNGTLPKGLTYSGGRISGTPTEKGTFELNATVEDGNLSSRAVKLTLTVSDTPPPQFSQFFPTAEQDSPFVYGIRIQARESRGFQIQVPLTDLRPTLDTLKAADGVLYVLRYNQERNVMDIDVAFTQPRTNFEALRLSIAPVADKKVRFASNGVLMALYDKNAKLVTNFQPMERQTSEGKYKYEDLLTLARNWGRGQAPQTAPAGQAPATPTTPAATPAQTPTTPTQTPTTPAQTPTTPTQPTTPETPPTAPSGSAENPTSQPAAEPASAQPTASAPETTAPLSQPAPATEQPTPPTETQPSPPTEPQTTQPNPPSQAPEQTPPSQPAQEQPAAPPAQSPSTPTTPAQPAQAQTTPAATPTQTQASSSTTQPAQGQPNGSAAQPAQGQPSQPAQTQPGQAAQKTDGGDLNNDGVVDAKDLELLRASYAWANVGNPAPRANPNPNQPNPGQPSQNQPGQTPPTPPPAGNTGTGAGNTN